MKNTNMDLTKPGLQGVRVLFGVTGSIAAYKAAEWVRALIKEEAIVTVMMTSAGQRFVSPLTFAALSGNRVYHEMFEEDQDGVMAHINLSRDNDVVLVAPATAQSMVRLSQGMANDLVSTTVLAAQKPVIVCPAMNTHMFTHPATQESIKKMEGYGYHVVAPGSGSLACGEVGDGRLPEWDVAREKLLQVLCPDDLAGQNIVITAGPTREAIDPARYLTNRSSGKMGYALARAAVRRGAAVTLISGPVNLPEPPEVTTVKVQSAQEMEEAVILHAKHASVIIKAAAVADYRPLVEQHHKIKKKADTFSLELVRNNDILARLGKERKGRQLLVGFAAESKNHQQEGLRKLTEKNVDLIVVNDILGNKTGFDVETNQVTLIDRTAICQLPLLSKEGTANQILNKVVELLAAQCN